MKIALIILAVFLAVVACVLIIGALLSRQHRVSRSISLHRPPHEVHSVVRDFASAPEWRPNLLRVEPLEPFDGRLRFREVAKGESVTYEVMEEVADEKLVTRIVDRDLGYSGSWTYAFSGTPGGTLVRITENGEVSNILFRFLSRFVFGHTSTMDAYLTALGRKFGEKVTPE